MALPSEPPGKPYLLVSHKKNEILLFETMSMDLENIMISDMSEKDKYCMISLYKESKKIKKTSECNHLPAMQETRVRFLGWEDPLEKEMAIHSSALAWKIPWTEEPDGLQYMGSQRVRHN